MSKESKHNDFESLCAGYVLDALDREEREQFEEMLHDATEEQHRILEDMKSVRDELALATDPATPSDKVEGQILDAIESPGNGSTAQKEVNIIPMWAYKAAAAILLIGLIGLSYYSSNLSEKVKQQQAVITQLRGEVNQQEELLNVLAAKNMQLINMAGLDPSPEGYGKIIWDPSKRQAILQLANLPVPPEDKDYQLWLIKEGQNPIPSGVFDFDQPSNDLFFKVEQLAKASASQQNTFAVTLEPEGGVPQPTGDMFLLGKQG